VDLCCITRNMKCYKVIYFLKGNNVTMLVDEVKGRLMTPSPSLLAHEE